MKAKYINTDSISLIDYDKTLLTINQNYDNAISVAGVTDDELKTLQENDSSEYENKKSLRERLDESRKSEIAELDKYVEFVSCERPELEDEYSQYRIYYTNEGNKVTEHCMVIINENAIKEKISSLKTQLSETDYVIIKTYEAKIALEDTPYTDEYVSEVITNRNAIRAEINTLEEKLKTVK